MGWGIKLGRFADVDVILHWTFFVVPLLVIVETWRSGLAVMGVVMALVLTLFACILLHEFGHSLTARAFGLKTQDIILTPIGGVARLQWTPENPWHELLITIAGPLVNAFIATCLASYLWLSGRSLAPPENIGSLSYFLSALLWMNIFIFTFNLIPAFPMDGGRILRSLLAMVIPHHAATIFAGYLGRIFGVIFLAVGLWYREWGIALIGLFVYAAAGAEISLSRSRRQFEQEFQIERAKYLDSCEPE
jgi:Zn-dependent protease